VHQIITDLCIRYSYIYTELIVSCLAAACLRALVWRRWPPTYYICMYVSMYLCIHRRCIYKGDTSTHFVFLYIHIADCLLGFIPLAANLLIVDQHLAFEQDQA